MKIYQNPDGSFEDEAGRPIDPRVANSTTEQGWAAGIGRTGRNAMENLVNMLPGDEMFKGQWSDKLLPERSPEDERYWQQMHEYRPISTAVGAGAVQALAPTSKKKLLDYGMAAGHGALFGDPDDPMWQRALEAVAGTGAGDMAGRIIGKLFNWKTDAARVGGSKTNQKMAQQFIDEGGQLTPGQITGSKALKNLESGMESGYFTGDLFEGMTDANATQFSRLAARAGGLPENTVNQIERLGIDDLNRMKKIHGAEFDRIRDQIPDLELDMDQADLLRDNMSGKMKKLLKLDGVDLGKKGEAMTLPGAAQMQVRSAFNKASSSPDGTSRQLYGKLVDLTDDMIEANITDPDLLNRWSQARQKYKVYKALDSARMNPEGGLTPGNTWDKLAGIEGGDAALDSLKNFTQAYASQSLKIPFNYSNTARAGLFKDPVGFMTNMGLAPLARNYVESGGSGILPGLLSPAPDWAVDVGKRLGRAYGAQE
jgi:hypothetical protein